MKAQLVKNSTGYILFDEKGIPVGATPNVLSNGTFSKLSLKNCKAIERGYDLDELTLEYFTNSIYPNYYQLFKDGFQKALEFTKDKKFSEEDVINIAEYVRVASQSTPNVRTKYLFNEYQSLQQTEWDVEVETEEISHYKGSRLIDEYRVNKLNSEGCLILKRV